MNHAIKVDPVQAMRVRLAIRWGVAPDDIGYWRAELELKRWRIRIDAIEQAFARDRAAGNGEEVLAWQ